jgi:hypothetical protein
MATLNARLLALETARPMNERTDHEANGFYFPQVMEPEAWAAAARVQQAELVKDTYEQNA